LKTAIDNKRLKRLRRAINSYILAQEDPRDNLELLQKYLKKKGIGDVSTEVLKREIKNQIEKKREKNRLEKMETKLFKKDDEKRKYRFGSAFCSNCDMYKDYQKECPYCGDLEITR